MTYDALPGRPGITAGDSGDSGDLGDRWQHVGGATPGVRILDEKRR